MKTVVIVAAIAALLGGCLRVEDPPNANSTPNGVRLIAKTPEGCALYLVASMYKVVVCPPGYSGGVAAQ